MEMATRLSILGIKYNVNENLWKVPFYVAIFSIVVFFLFILYGIIKLATEPTSGLWDNYRFVQALKVSLLSSTISSITAFLLALPLGYAFSRKIVPGSRAIETLTLIFLGLPPVGIGIALLAFFSGTYLGKLLDSIFGIVFTFKGIVLAQLIVVFPIVVKFVKEVIDTVPSDLEEVYQAFGGTKLYTFINIVLPYSYKGLIAAWMIGWLRSLGEFGATVVISGIIYGKTETFTVYMYTLLSSADIINASRVMLILITIVIFVSFIINLYKIKKLI